MASCEKCWRDAGGDPVKYAMLIDFRTGTEDECTPEESAGGEDAKLCPKCDRRTVHCVLDRCVNPRFVDNEFPDDE